MPKISLGGFKDPARRPRYIIWTGVVVLVLATVTIVALGVTSAYWFCSEGCHKVQDDTITAYNNSTHNKINCMACHMPVNASPVTFMAHKMTALGELYLTVTGNYEIPLNKGSHLAMDAHHMPSEQCTQCHSDNRVVTPTPGIIIDHEIHVENDVTCTMCHNRVAHDETGITFVNEDPTTGELNHGHPDFMEMTACFRCHSLETDGLPPGACSACHPADFQLKPPSHLEEGFFPVGHAELANEQIEKVEGGGESGHDGETEAESEEMAAEGTTESAEAGEGEESTATEAAEDEHAEEEATATAADDEHADDEHADDEHAEDGEGDGHEDVYHDLPTVDEINECYTCHLESFCMNCHGMEIPHPEEFLTTTHGEISAQKMDKCDMCHNVVETDFQFCNECHHGTESDWEYAPDQPWQQQHAKAVSTNGVDGCLEQCHDKKFCQDCHNELNPIPSSHKSAKWLHNELTVTKYGETAAKPTAEHATTAIQAVDACEVCHGDGGTEAKFCKDCHELEMPHPDDFKEFHAKTGRDDPEQCQSCHQFSEICSNCHHVGASPTKSWQEVHGPKVVEIGADECLEACHADQKFCVDCHTKENAVPASHNANDWTRRTNVDQPAKHPAAYDSNAESCGYCHGEGGPNDNKFCSSCHAIEMPHPAEFKDTHAPDFQEGTLNRATCENCHQQLFCDSCHHEGSTGSKPWQLEHPAIVKENGADPCFECHEPTYCAECHVGLSR